MIWSVDIFRVARPRIAETNRLPRRTDPRGRPYYWIGGDVGPVYARRPGTDAEAALSGWISVTPLRMDLACPEVIAREGEFLELFGERP